jgi:hypothetical protein
LLSLWDEGIPPAETEVSSFLYKIFERTTAIEKMIMDSFQDNFKQSVYLLECSKSTKSISHIIGIK